MHINTSLLETSDPLTVKKSSVLLRHLINDKELQCVNPSIRLLARGELSPFLEHAVSSLIGRGQEMAQQEHDLQNESLRMLVESDGTQIHNDQVFSV